MADKTRLPFSAEEELDSNKFVGGAQGTDLGESLVPAPAPVAPAPIVDYFEQGAQEIRDQFASDPNLAMPEPFQPTPLRASEA